MKTLHRLHMIGFAVVIVGGQLSGATATAYLPRTVNGPSAVVPGHAYGFYVSGFTPGETVYATVQPFWCARTSERCEQTPCHSLCGEARIGPSGTANVRFGWPKTSAYAFSNMDIRHDKWRRGTLALVRIDDAQPSPGRPACTQRGCVVPRGCQQMPSITANPDGGSIVCAATLTDIR